MQTYTVVEKNRARDGTLWTLVREVWGQSVEISVPSSKGGAELAKARLERLDTKRAE